MLKCRKAVTLLAKHRQLQAARDAAAIAAPPPAMAPPTVAVTAEYVSVAAASRLPQPALPNDVAAGRGSVDPPVLYASPPATLPADEVAIASNESVSPVVQPDFAASPTTFEDDDDEDNEDEVLDSDGSIGRYDSALDSDDEDQATGLTEEESKSLWQF